MTVHTALLLPLLPLFLATAQRNAPDDSLLFRFREEVLVTAARLGDGWNSGPAAVERFSADAIAGLPGRSLGDLLRHASGASVRSYGADGSLQSVSFRGLGPEYTTVILNGVRLNDEQNSVVDFSRVSMRDLAQVAIARGGLSALYGGNALGGVVSIATDGRAPLSLSLGGGSYGWWSGRAVVPFSIGEGALSASASYERADNGYPVPALGNGTGGMVPRQNADLRRLHVACDGDYRMSSIAISMYADVTATEIGVPGARVSAAQGRARENTLGALFATSIRAPLGRDIVLRVTPSVSFLRDRYRDPALAINGATLDSRYDNVSAGASASVEHAPNPSIRYAAGVEVRYSTLRSAEVRDNPSRAGGALFVSGEYTPDPADRALCFYPSLRFDYADDIPGGRSFPALSPSLGVRAAVLGDALTVHARAGRGVRLPTFNQLYWLQGGNASLRPEYAASIDAGLQTVFSARASIDVTWFHHDIRDKIVWMPGSTAFWTPTNLQHVVSDGVEASARGTIPGTDASATLNSQWISSRKVSAAFPGDATAGKQLMYVPAWSGSLMLDTPLLSRFRVSATVQYIGARYYTETHDKAVAGDGRAFLPPYALLDAACMYAVGMTGLEITFKLEALNLLDIAYEAVAGFPMPGRSFRCTVTTTFPSERDHE